MPTPKFGTAFIVSNNLILLTNEELSKAIAANLQNPTPDESIVMLNREKPAKLVTEVSSDMTEAIEQLAETKECIDCDLQNADLTDVDLKQANLEGANLAGANLEKANLQNSYLMGANLKDINIQLKNVPGYYSFGKAFLDAFIIGIPIFGATNDGVHFKTNLTEANLEGANLTEAKLEEVFVTDANFGNADFSNAKIESINFEEANFCGATFTEETLLNEVDC